MEISLATALEMAHHGIGPLYERALEAAMRRDATLAIVTGAVWSSLGAAHVQVTEWRGTVTL